MQRPKTNRRPEAQIENMPQEWLRFNRYKPMQQSEQELESSGTSRKTNSAK